MISSAAHPGRFEDRLKSIDSLINRAILDLTLGSSNLLGTQCGKFLSQVHSELESFAKNVSESKLDKTAKLTVVAELKSLLSKLAQVERLFASAAEFYRGWSAAGLIAPATISGYEANGSQCGPMLLAFEG